MPLMKGEAMDKNPLMAPLHDQFPNASANMMKHTADLSEPAKVELVNNWSKAMKKKGHDPVPPYPPSLFKSGTPDPNDDDAEIGDLQDEEPRDDGENQLNDDDDDKNIQFGEHYWFGPHIWFGPASKPKATAMDGPIRAD